MVTVSTITLERQGIFRRGLNVLESTHSELQFEKQIQIMCRCRGVKMEVQRFALEFVLEIFVLYRVINHLEIKFWVKYTLVGSNFRAVIAQKMC